MSLSQNFQDNDSNPEKYNPCMICNQKGPHPDDITDEVKWWPIEKADQIPIAHLTCLKTQYCIYHSCYMPCT